jgi:hypothetical protein
METHGVVKPATLNRLKFKSRYRLGYGSSECRRDVQDIRCDSRNCVFLEYRLGLFKTCQLKLKGAVGTMEHIKQRRGAAVVLMELGNRMKYLAPTVSMQHVAKSIRAGS